MCRKPLLSLGWGEGLSWWALVIIVFSIFLSFLYHKRTVHWLYFSYNLWSLFQWSESQWAILAALPPYAPGWKTCSLCPFSTAQKGNTQSKNVPAISELPNLKNTSPTKTFVKTLRPCTEHTKDVYLKAPGCRKEQTMGISIIKRGAWKRCLVAEYLFTLCESESLWLV